MWPKMPTATFRVWFIYVSRTRFHWTLLKYVDRGVAGGVLCWCRCMIRSEMHWMRHRVGLPLHPKPITSPRMLFFWLVSSNVTNVACRRVVDGVVTMHMYVVPMNNWTSEMVKGVLSDGEEVYSPGQSKKKKAITIICDTADTTTRLAASAILTVLDDDDRDRFYSVGRQVRFCVCCPRPS